jgi:hypothetical protein
VIYTLAFSEAVVLDRSVRVWRIGDGRVGGHRGIEG